MSLLPATATTPADDDPIRYIPVGHIFPTVRDDQEASEVAALVAEGWDQWTASYLVHTGEMPAPLPPVWDAPPAAHSTWCVAWVTALFTPLARAVGLR